MQHIDHDYIFSTAVSDSNDENEFVVEFFPGNGSGASPIRVTNSFDELIDFLEEM
ncbi:hypothetical protein [Neobacillus fumarioli]|uniref:hypothetical protein n=1 Tax=Neobacillus fumarioli TaxID=105229 RepID=UPI000AA1B5DB|nr:hypothetical protein [Neobacillus fumarioli]